MSITDRPLTFLCLANFFKGNAFLQAAKQLGHHVLLLTQEKHQDEPWARASIDELFFLPSLSKQPDITYTVAYLARGRHIDAIIALDDFDVETAAALREHLRLPGLSVSAARHFRDKLAMRQAARAGGVAVPEFTRVVNYDELREFMDRVPAPWLLKPRSEASSMGIQRLYEAEQLWRTLDRLGDQQSFFVLEQYLPGEVYHVDALVDGGEPVFAVASQYGRPPLNVYQDGGVFITRTLDPASADCQALLDANRRMLRALGLTRGAAHAEFLKSNADGQFYFIECAARVGGANIAETVEFASGVNLWAEWARLEAGHLRGEAYALPALAGRSAGILVCLAQQEWPDTSSYTDPEIVWRLNKKNHAGLIVAGPDAGRIQALLESYGERFAHDFLAVAPPRQSVAEM
ncbi:MAG: ATP-grasp domain-containing protein [Anaerolineales bacterium]|nr:ATP-grasp domain-containing protein [Anaerolineales bacterium]